MQTFGNRVAIFSSSYRKTDVFWFVKNEDKWLKTWRMNW